MTTPMIMTDSPMTDSAMSDSLGRSVRHEPDSAPDEPADEAFATVRLDRHTQLADFLRTRRERLSPADVGFAPGPRRRAHGLRREEVAELAGISTAWYTWLEQGRPINPSTTVLAAIAKALQLDADERSHLFRLAQPPSERPMREHVSPLLARLLRGYRWAAYAINRRWDVLAWNDAASELFVEFASTPERERNLLRYMFLDPRMKHVFVDWEAHATLLVALFRSSIARYPHDTTTTELVSGLRRASRDFDTCWAGHHVKDSATGLTVLRRADGKQMHVEYATFQPDDTPTIRVVMYVPTGPLPEAS